MDIGAEPNTCEEAYFALAKTKNAVAAIKI
jgi:hypothetical protein